MIKVYMPEEKMFNTNGLGTIRATSCIETKKKGIQEWKLEIKADIKYKDVLVKDNIVVAETKEKGAQAFRLQEPVLTDKCIEITAKHILYDAENLILVDVRPENQSAVGYMRWCNERTDTKSPFTIGGDAAGTGTNYFVRKTLLEAMEQAQETFQAVFDCDNFNLRIMSSVGQDNGYKVAYGKNIQGIKITQSWSEVVTKLLPVGTNELLLPEVFLHADISYKRPYTKVVKFEVPESDEDGNEIPEITRIDTLRTLAKQYIEDNKYPKIAYEVKSDVPQDLSIGDTIHIKHPLVDIPAEVQGYTYDCISKKVKTITFGNYDNSNSSYYQTTMKNAINAAVDGMQEIIDGQNTHLSAVDIAMKKMNEEILNSTGFYTTEVVEDNTTTFYMHDKPKLENSKLVWRASAEVLSVSTDGGKTWNAAVDASGEAILQILSVNGINADWVKTGTISSRKINNGKFTVDEDGNVVAKAIDIQGGIINIKTAKEKEDVIQLNYTQATQGYAYDKSIKISPSSLEQRSEYHDGSKEEMNISSESISGQYTFSGATAGYTMSANGLQQRDNISGSEAISHYATYRAYLEENGNYIVGTVSGGWAKGSDRRLKEDISKLDSKMSLLQMLEPVKYKLIGMDGTHFGFIAQEVEEALDHIGYDDARLVTKPSRDNKYYGLDYNEFVPILWKVCQELEQRVRKLEEVIDGENA